MKSKFIKNTESESLITFSSCLKKAGIYQQQTDYENREYLVVIHEPPHEVYFGIYDNGDIFPYADMSDDRKKRYKRLGDLDLTIKLIKDNE